MKDLIRCNEINRKEIDSGKVKSFYDNAISGTIFSDKIRKNKRGKILWEEKSKIKK